MKELRWKMVGLIAAVMLAPVAAYGSEATGVTRQAALAPVSLAVGASSVPVGSVAPLPEAGTSSAPTRPDASSVPAMQDWESVIVRRPVVRVGQDYTLRAGETVRDLRTALGDVTLEGQVEHDAFVILGSVHVKSTAVVERALVVLGGSATIDEGARVSGDLVVIGGAFDAPAGFAPGGEFVAIGSQQFGDALRAFVPWLTRGLLWGRLIVPDLGWVWAVFGVMLLIYLLANTLFDGPVAASADAVRERPFSVFFLGLLVLVLIVPALAILAATVIGLLIVPFVICAIVVAALVGKAGISRAIGRGLLGTQAPESKLMALATFLLGAVVLGLSYMVPVVGIITWALTTVLAMGAAAVMVRRRLRREQFGRRRAPAASAAPPPVAPGEQGRAEPPAFGEPRPGEPLTDAPYASSAFADTAATVQPPPFAGAPTSDGLPPGTLPRAPGIATPFPLATFLDRVAAFALDALLVALVVELLGMSRHDGVFPLLLLAYHIAFWTWKGTTLGGIVVGLRVTRVQGQEMRFIDALVRGLVGVFSIGAFGIGCFWMLQDPNRQMWHDKIAGTQVHKVPRELVLQEE